KLGAFNAGWIWGGERFTLPPEAHALTVPVRGQLAVEYERSLVFDRKALPSIALLRLRALDVAHPVFSSLRCGLFQQAWKRFEVDSSEIDDILAAKGSETRAT